MEQKRLEMLQQYAAKAGISMEELHYQLDKLENNGELGVGYLKKVISSDIQNQMDARSLFRMAAQEGEFSDTDVYLETFPNLPSIDYLDIRRKFETYAINRGRLQQKNIMITPEMWHILVENPKDCISGKFMKKTVDKGRGQIMFSQLFALPNLESLDSSIAHRKNCDALILRTIQFDFFNVSTDYEEKTEKRFTKEEVQNLSRYYDNFIRDADETMFNNIYKIAEDCLDFSIHEYYLPYGFSLQGLKNAVLLMRYDHCSDKHINSVLPKYYNSAYNNSITQPHFHFNEGLGQIYKLLTKNGQGNFGSGFAIGAPDLVGYLNKLTGKKELTGQERSLILNNDFGMPFLAMMRRDCGNATGRSETLRKMAIDVCMGNFTGAKNIELAQAYNFLNVIDGLPSTNLEDFTIISKQKEEERPRNR